MFWKGEKDNIKEVIDLEKKLTEEDCLKALHSHAAEKGCAIFENYGPVITDAILQEILANDELTRFPVELKFSSGNIPAEMFGVVSENKTEGKLTYTMHIHEHFKNETGVLPFLVLYLLVSVNYGSAADCEVAEIFASSALGMDQDDYYNQLCALADSIPVGC